MSRLVNTTAFREDLTSGSPVKVRIARMGAFLVVRLPLAGSRIGLEDCEGIALRILTDCIPSHTRYTNLAN